MYSPVSGFKDQPFEKATGLKLLVFNNGGKMMTGQPGATYKNGEIHCTSQKNNNENIAIKNWQI